MLRMKCKLFPCHRPKCMGHWWMSFWTLAITESKSWESALSCLPQMEAISVPTKTQSAWLERARDNMERQLVVTYITSKITKQLLLFVLKSLLAPMCHFVWQIIKLSAGSAFHSFCQMCKWVQNWTSSYKFLIFFITGSLWKEQNQICRAERENQRIFGRFVFRTLTGRKGPVKDLLFVLHLPVFIMQLSVSY